MKHTLVETSDSYQNVFTLVSVLRRLAMFDLVYQTSFQAMEVEFLSGRVVIKLSISVRISSHLATRCPGDPHNIVIFLK
jgi:hypothetical protein